MTNYHGHEIRREGTHFTGNIVDAIVGGAFAVCLWNMACVLRKGESKKRW